MHQSMMIVNRHLARIDQNRCDEATSRMSLETSIPRVGMSFRRWSMTLRLCTLHVYVLRPCKLRRRLLLMVLNITMRHRSHDTAFRSPGLAIGETRGSQQADREQKTLLMSSIGSRWPFPGCRDAAPGLRHCDIKEHRNRRMPNAECRMPNAECRMPRNGA